MTTTETLQKIHQIAASLVSGIDGSCIGRADVRRLAAEIVRLSAENTQEDK